MITRSTISSLAVALLLALPSAAFSENPSPSRQRIEAKRGDKAAVRAALERFRKAGSGTRGTRLEPVKRVKTEIVGRLIRGGNGDVFVEREVDARTAELLQRMGYRLVLSEKAIDDKTVFGNKVYLLYQMDKDAVTSKSPEHLKGQPVTLEVRHDSKGTPLITSLKKAER